MKVAVFGSGAWGTAIANVIANNNSCVTLYYRDHAKAQYHMQNRRHPALDVSLHHNIFATSNINDLLTADILFIAIPVQKIRNAITDLLRAHENYTTNTARNNKSATALSPSWNNDKIFVLCSKGIEQNTLLFPSEIVRDIAPAIELSVISGPNFADDVARCNLIKTTIAAYKMDVAEKVSALFQHSTLITDISLDPIGVQICGALKNVYAVGAGIMQGLHCCKSTVASYLTASLIELTTTLQSMKSDVRTAFSAAGVGDFILTCTNHASRNYKFGLQISSNHKISSPIPTHTTENVTVEGYHTTKAIALWSAQNSISLPICDKIFDILYNGASPEIILRSIEH